jgi:DNA-binding MarR family transcriptional regulator
MTGDPLIERQLTAEERSVLIVLMQEGRASEDSTARGVATVFDRDSVDVPAVLQRLEREGLASRQGDGAACWIATI